MMILDLSIRKRKHPESPDYSTPEQTPKRDDSATTYYHTHPNSLTEFLEHFNPCDFFTSSSTKLRTIEAFPKEPLSFTCGLEKENEEPIVLESFTPYTKTRWVLSQVQASTDETNVIMRRNQLHSSKNKHTSSSPKLKTRPFTPQLKYPLHLSSTTYYAQIKNEVPQVVSMGHKIKIYSYENLKMHQPQNLKFEDTSNLESDEKNNEATERSIGIRSAHCLSECSGYSNPSNSYSSLSPELKTRLFKSHPNYPFHVSSGFAADEEKELPISSTTFYSQYRDEVHSQVEKMCDISNENMNRNQLQSLKYKNSSCLENNKKTIESLEESIEANLNCSTEYSKNCNSSEISIYSFPKLKTRPFKAFPNGLFSGLVLNNDEVLPNVSTKSYTQFRDSVLSQVQANPNASNENMRRNQLKSSDNEDPSYLEKRKKNNEAAKKSRDARKAKEDEIAIRCAFLEQENMELRNRLNILDSYVGQLGSCFRYT